MRRGRRRPSSPSQAAGPRARRARARGPRRRRRRVDRYPDQDKLMPRNMRLSARRSGTAPSTARRGAAAASAPAPTTNGTPIVTKLMCRSADRPAAHGGLEEHAEVPAVEDEHEDREAISGRRRTAGRCEPAGRASAPGRPRRGTPAPGCAPPRAAAAPRGRRSAGAGAVGGQSSSPSPCSGEKNPITRARSQMPEHDLEAIDLYADAPAPGRYIERLGGDDEDERLPGPGRT